MTIPTTRSELVEQIEISFGKLQSELEKGGPDLPSLPCVDNWTVKDMLAVRAWWTEGVLGWIEAGRRGERPVTPAEGYRWTETPRLNNDIVGEARSQSFTTVRSRLEAGVKRILAVIGELDDRDLLETGRFAWAGKWPIARWVSINTVRQYTTARSFVRKAIRDRAARSK